MAGLFIKLDTNYWSHPKVLAAGEAAGVLYQQMAMYCMDHATDGVVPCQQMPRFGLARLRARVEALARAGLIEPAEGGWLLPGYVERYKTAAEVDELRRKRSEAGKQGGRPRKQGAKANGNQIAFTAHNPEEEIEEELEPSSSSHGPATRPPTPDDDDEATQLRRLAGIAHPGPDDGERATVARAMARGWTFPQLADKARKAAASGNPAAYWRAALDSCLDELPPVYAPAADVDRRADETRGLLDDERDQCDLCGGSGMTGGIGPDGLPDGSPVTRCTHPGRNTPTR